MNKKAFTLAEILGVIVIIGLLAVIITPLVINRLKGNSDVVSTANNDLIFASTDEYIKENIENYPPGKNYCIKVQELMNSGHLSDKMKNIITGENLNEYYVSANIYGVGNVDYNLYKTKEECENVKPLPVITFTVNNGWNQTKDVIINYPEVNNSTYPEKGSDWKYKIDSGDWIELSESQAYNKNNKINVTNDGTVIYAEMKYGDRVIKNKIRIDMISNKKPSIELADFKTSDNLDIKTNCNDENNITMTFTAKGGTKIDKYAVTVDEGEPSQWVYVNKNNKVTVKYKVLDSNDKKTHHIHVIDTAGNRETTSFIPNIVHTINYDVNNPDNTNNIIINTTSKQIVNGQTYSSPQPSKVGYTFNGWYKDKTYSQKVNDSDMLCLNNDQTLYAKWTLAYTRPTCELTISAGTKGNVADNKQWYISNVTITMATSTGLGKPTSFGIDSTPYQTNGRVSATQSNDTKGTTFYGYVENPAGSSTCQITVYKDATAPTYSKISGGGNTWYRGNVAVTNVGSDATSGISTWQYQSTPQLQANAHVQSYGWFGDYSYGIGNTGGSNFNHEHGNYDYYGPIRIVGTTGIGKNLEAFQLKIINSSIAGGISYATNGGGYVSDGTTAGATGVYYTIRKVSIKLTGNLANYYNVSYRSHRNKIGWDSWTSNGTYTPETSERYIQGIDIKLDKKSGVSIPWTSVNNANGTYTHTFTQEQDTTNYFRLCDKAGNCSSSKSVVVKIDKTPPVSLTTDVMFNSSSICTGSNPRVVVNTACKEITKNGKNVSGELRVDNFANHFTYSFPGMTFDNLSGYRQIQNKYIHNGGGSCYRDTWTNADQMCWSTSSRGTYRKLYSRIFDNAENVTGEIYNYVH